MDEPPDNEWALDADELEIWLNFDLTQYNGSMDEAPDAPEGEWFMDMDGVEMWLNYDLYKAIDP